MKRGKTLAKFDAKKFEVECARNLESDRGHIRMCARWRKLRAQQQMLWAERDEETLFGYGSDSGPPGHLDAVDEMRKIEGHLSISRPDTVLLAREMLRIAVIILAERMITHDPGECGAEYTLAEGPALEIVRNVAAGLDFANGQIRLVGA